MSIHKLKVYQCTTLQGKTVNSLFQHELLDYADERLTVLLLCWLQIAPTAFVIKTRFQMINAHLHLHTLSVAKKLYLRATELPGNLHNR